MHIDIIIHVSMEALWYKLSCKLFLNYFLINIEYQIFEKLKKLI